MIVLVTGGRLFYNRTVVYETLDGLHRLNPITMLIHGNAKGADKLAEQWARTNNVHFAAVPALWDNFGDAAGGIRNSAMLILKPDFVVSFPGGKGTADMTRKAKKAGLLVLEIEDKFKG